MYGQVAEHLLANHNSCFTDKPAFPKKEFAGTFKQLRGFLTRDEDETQATAVTGPNRHIAQQWPAIICGNDWGVFGKTTWATPAEHCRRATASVFGSVKCDVRNQLRRHLS